MSTNYELILKQAEALTKDVPFITANLANISALIYSELDRLNWAGFYITEKDELILGPFQGKPACVRIPFGRGVCGTAAATGETQLVKNVHEFPGHIPCDCASNSEIVVPIHKDGKIFGVLDIDSPDLGRFTEEDKEGLENLVKIIEKII